MKVIKPLRLSVLSRPFPWQRRQRLGLTVIAMTGMDADAPVLYPDAELWPLVAEEIGEQGVLDASWQLSAIPRPWTKTPNHAWESRNMQVYAAMIDRMDQGIGRLVAELERQQQLDDTVVIYLQDNGGCAEGMGRQSNADKIREAVASCSKVSTVVVEAG